MSVLIRWLVLLTLVLGFDNQALAQRPPETHPVSAERRIVLAYDRSALPGDEIIWAPRTIIGYSRDAGLQYGQLYFVCESDTDAARGRCPTSDTGEMGAGEGRIALLFIERRSGLRTEVNVSGYLQRADSTIACSTTYWESGFRPLSTSAGAECNGDPPVGTGASLIVPSLELEKMVAGRWDATLKLELRNPSSGALAEYKFVFDLTITDQDRASIYFPASDNVTPLVNLNINYMPVPSPAHIEGGTSLDMCLYDGLGSQIPYLEVSIRDDGAVAPGRAPGMHSVWHRDGGHGNESRLDYEVTLDYGGVPLRMENNVMQRLNGIDTTQLRLVVLPGMSQPVYCVPTPLKLRVPRVLAADKLAGYYEGQMIIQMIVPSATP